MKKSNDIEKLFKESFKNYSKEPSANAWANIQSNLSQATAATSTAASGASSIASWVNIALVVAGIGGLAVTGYYFFNQTAEKHQAEKELTLPDTQTELDISATTNGSSESKSIVEEALEPRVNSELQNTNTKAVNPTAANSLNEQTELKKQDNLDDNQKDSELTILENKENNDNELEQDSQQTEESNETNLEANENQFADDLSNETSTEVSSNTEQKEANTDVEEKSNKENIASQSVSEEAEKIETPKVDVPNIFSPNGDGTNDYFLLNACETDDVHVLIYSKTSRLIYEWKGKFGKWDGTLPNGTPAPEGNYFYQIILKKDNQIFEPKKGTFYLSRN